MAAYVQANNEVLHSRGMTDQARALLLTGVHNMRDYGGYACALGRLKGKLLFRSGDHVNASDADLVRIDELGLVTVIDLRAAAERRAAPCRRSPAFAAEVVCASDDTSGMAPHLQAAQLASQQAMDVSLAHVEMINRYRGMPYRPALQHVFRGYFQAVANSCGPSLVHCAAGKDRTGLAVALLHLALGVHRDDVIHDYMLTNTTAGAERQLTEGAELVRAIYGQDVSDAVVTALMGVDESYIEAAFLAIETKSGSLDHYLSEVLGVDAAMRERLVEHLIE